MRIDKYLWCIRLFKTRSQAAKAVEQGKVQINHAVIKKPSKELKAEDTFQIRYQPIWRSFRVLQFPKNRVGAKLVSEHMVEITPQEDLELLAQVEKENRQLRLQGQLGRPTKKNRRDMEDFMDW